MRTEDRRVPEGLHTDGRHRDEALGDEADRWLRAHDPIHIETAEAKRKRAAKLRLESYHRTKVLSGATPHPTPKLTPDEVLTIRAIRDTDPSATVKDLASHFGVSRETIWAVITRRTWRSL